MPRNFGVKRHPYQPIDWRMRLGDAFAVFDNWPMRFVVGGIAVASVLLMASCAQAAQVCASGGRYCASVAASARPTLQCVVDHIEAAGVHITALGGIRRGHCSSRSMHPCGKALDVNQTARDVNGPPRSVSSAAATACGAVSGSWWARNPDNGHFQVGGWAGNHGNTVTASAHRRHHRRHRMASR